MKIFFALSMFLFIGCTDNKDEWTILFDGDSVSHWRGFNQEKFPFDGWAIENGTLKTIVGGNKVDIITKQVYKDFELADPEWNPINFNQNL